MTVSHSFSKSFFDEKFFREGLRDYHYDLYQLKEIKDLKKLLGDNPELCGLNVTIPYKEQVINLLSDIDEAAARIGAVNVIKIKDGKLRGFNTDSDAFFESVDKWFPNETGSKALILGTGGSSKAVQEALKKLSASTRNARRNGTRRLATRQPHRTRPTSTQAPLPTRGPATPKHRSAHRDRAENGVPPTPPPTPHERP